MAFNDALLGLISPNIFEIFAVEHMDQSLRSALKYTIKVLWYARTCMVKMCSEWKLC